MTSYPINHTTTHLTYRLPDSVLYLIQREQLVLILNYPLKVVKLKGVWKPVFDRLSQRTWVSLESLLTSVAGLTASKVEVFLHDLVCKGLLERTGTPETTDFPLVSILIPVKNRPGEMASCLESLIRLNYPGDRSEVIVVDDGSTDHTADVIRHYPVTLISLAVSKQAPFCRNLAASSAKGEILALIDSDCTADRSWIRELLPAFNNPVVGAVGGFVDASVDHGKLDRYEKVKSSLNQGNRFRCSSRSDRSFYLPSCNLLVRKTVFQKLGGFNENLIVGEDVDFCWRLQDAGYRIEYQPIGKIYHKHRNTIVSFGSRRFDYGTSEPLLQRKHPARKKILVWPVAALVFWVLLGLSMALSFPGFAVPALITGIGDTWLKAGKSRKKGLALGPWLIGKAVFRSYLTFLYHCCAFISRYYLICLPLLFMFTMAGSVALLTAHLITGIAEFRLKRPHLPLPVFLVYFTWEQLSYQAGVWWGCFHYRNFSAVFPRIAFSKLEL